VSPADNLRVTPDPGAYPPRVKEAIVGRQGRAVLREHVPGHAKAWTPWPEPVTSKVAPLVSGSQRRADGPADLVRLPVTVSAAAMAARTEARPG
jgi:hypothetical protein